MTDIQKIQALAEAAVEQSENIGEAAWYTADCLQHLLHAGAPDAEFIAAANPAAVLELIAELQGYQQGADVEAQAADEARAEVRRLKAENERLQRFETAYKEFSDKTDWVRPNAAAHELAMHVADVIRKRCDDLTSHNQAQAEEIVRLREQVRAFTGSAYPVSREINQRGYNWSEAWLEAALGMTREQQS
jgi:hypothetical protein